jgi:hypothetical protein
MDLYPDEFIGGGRGAIQHFRSNTKQFNADKVHYNSPQLLNKYHQMQQHNTTCIRLRNVDVQRVST